MSEREMLKVVSRALINAKFRFRLFADPDSTLSTLNLTDSEKQILANLQPGSLNDLAEEITERLSLFAVLPGYKEEDAIRADLWLTTFDLKRLFDYRSQDKE